MKARRAARELALLAFSQLCKDVDNLQDKDIEDIILTSVRTLTSDAENSVKKSIGALLKIREYVETYEFEHPENLERPIGVSNIPVAMPLTSDMLGRVDTLIDAGDKTLSAIELAEISALANTSEVKNYAINLVKTYIKNKDEVDEEINKHSKGWNIERMVRIDRDILRIAVVELLYLEDIDAATSINEAVELAKKYSTEESSSFINGILREVVEAKKLVYRPKS